MPEHSHLVKMVIKNFCCIGSEGLEIELDDIICLVGPNNTGKSTVLKAYEHAVENKALNEEDFPLSSDQKPSVEIYVHIPKGVQNIDEKWKIEMGKHLIVRSRWQWNEPRKVPERATWNPEIEDYDPDFKASGLDTVFSSRLPKPLRICALEGPEEEHNELLKIVLEPIEKKLKLLVEDEDSSLNSAIQKVKDEIKLPVHTFVETIKQIKKDVNASYQKTFPNCEVDLNIDVSDLDIRPMALLQKASRVNILEKGGCTSWRQQGIGSQRALFWSMLEIRSKLLQRINDTKHRESRLKFIPSEIEKLKKQIEGLTRESAKETRRQQIAVLEQELKELTDPKKDDHFLPSYMLLIDEPEVALHPNAVRAARDHLYELAQDAGWQVMLTTHNPAFVNPLADHTTIVRLTREDNKPTPKIYRSEEVTFSEDGKENLKMLLQFDTSLAEAFFGGYPVIIEGDTEYAAFQKIMELHSTDFPIEKRPVLVRARGKFPIKHIANILIHFKIPFSVLHDSDSPKNKDGSKNSAWKANEDIMTILGEVKDTDMRVVHRVSIPDFERAHGLEAVNKEKPFNFQKQIASSSSIQKTVKKQLQELISDKSCVCVYNNDSKELTKAVEKWAQVDAS